MGRNMSDSLTKTHHTDLAIDHARKDFARLSADHAVGEALTQIRRTPPEGRFVYFYVVDSENRLQGVVPPRRLFLNPPETRVADIMVKKVITIPSSATVLDACEYFVLHRLLAFPVVDTDQRVLGVIDVELYTDEITDLAEREE